MTYVIIRIICCWVLGESLLTTYEFYPLLSCCMIGDRCSLSVPEYFHVHCKKEENTSDWSLTPPLNLRVFLLKEPATFDSAVFCVWTLFRLFPSARNILTAKFLTLELLGQRLCMLSRLFKYIAKLSFRKCMLSSTMWNSAIPCSFCLPIW